MRDDHGLGHFVRQVEEEEIELEEEIEEEVQLDGAGREQGEGEQDHSGLEINHDLGLSTLQNKEKYQGPTKSELRFKPRGQGYTCDLCGNSMIIYNTKISMSHHLRTYHALGIPKIAQYNLQKVGTRKPVETHKSKNLPLVPLFADDADFLVKFVETVEYKERKKRKRGKTNQNSKPIKDMTGRHKELSLLSYKFLGNHECLKCSETFVLELSLLKHMKWHGANSLFKCQVKMCDYSNNNGKVLSKHMKRAHPENNHPVCPNCYVKFVTMNELMVHTNENMQSVAIVCVSTQCQMRFEAKCGLEIHTREKHLK